MPFCRKCAPSEYQPYYDSVECLNCPSNMTSPRASVAFTNCTEIEEHICHTNKVLCGPHGVCMRESENPQLYTCLCEDGFTGNEVIYPLCSFLFSSS